MKIVIAGGSGFLGRALTNCLVAEGHLVTILSRAASDGATIPVGPPARASASRAFWRPDGTVGPWAAVLDGADAVVNLAGASIGERRWSAAEKARIRDSRVLATRSLVAAIGSAAKPPRVFLSGSAQGYYGPRGDEILTENAEAGRDFLAVVCAEWEREALKAQPFVERLTLLRTSLAFDRQAGVLPRMLTPFRFLAGGPVGSGRQYVSWIHRDDWVGLARWAILNEQVSGPLNVTSPSPIRNAELSRHIGLMLHRPSVVPAPAFMVRLAFGEMGESLILTSQRVVPAKATALGFSFRFPNLGDALRDILQRA